MTEEPKAVFMDRDGILHPDVGPTVEPRDCYPLPTVETALSVLESAGFQLILVTHQPAMYSGQHSQDDTLAFTEEIIATTGNYITNIYIVDGPEEAQQTFESCQAFYELDPNRCWYVGTKGEFLGAAAKGGVFPIHLQTGADKESIGLSFESFLKAALFICKQDEAFHVGQYL